MQKPPLPGRFQLVKKPFDKLSRLLGRVAEELLCKRCFSNLAEEKAFPLRGRDGDAREARDGSAETKRKRSAYAVRRMRCQRRRNKPSAKANAFYVSTSSVNCVDSFPSKGKPFS